MNSNQKHYIMLQHKEDDSLEKSLCHELTCARSTVELTQRIHTIVNTLGFSNFLFLRLERAWQADSTYGLLHSLPEELMRVYHESRLHDIDLIIQFGKNNTQPIFSSQIYDYIDQAPFEMQLTQQNRQLTQLYKRFNFYEHCVIPMPAFNRNGHVQLLLTNAKTSTKKLQAMATPIMPICRSLCKAIDSVSTKKFHATFIDKHDKKDNPFKITQKPLDILRRLAYSDATITDVATEMFISPITAHQHIAAARKALCAKTNIGAIVKAIKSGLIQLD